MGKTKYAGHNGSRHSWSCTCF